MNYIALQYQRQLDRIQKEIWTGVCKEGKETNAGILLQCKREPWASPFRKLGISGYKRERSSQTRMQQVWSMRKEENSERNFEDRSVQRTNAKNENETRPP